MLSLQEARDKAAEGRRYAKAGLDPAVEWKKVSSSVPTFEKHARSYHLAAGPGWRNDKHRDQWLATLETYVFPEIGALRVDQIEAADVQRVLMPIWLSRPETARRVRQRTLAVLDDAHAAKVFGDDGRYELMDAVGMVKEATQAVNDGDLSGVMATLVAQSVHLDAIFTSMSARAFNNINGGYFDAGTQYLQLALKAQARAAATAEAIAKMSRGGQQTVRVVHVHPGGQAVVADTVNNNAPGRVTSENDGQAHEHEQVADVAIAALSGPDPARDGVPLPSHEGQEAVPIARGEIDRGTEG